MTETKYRALRDELETMIKEQLLPHDLLPSERQLMKTHGVSRMTVRQAIQCLEDEGMVYRVQGSGTFVSDPTTISKTLALTSFSEDIRARGMTPGARLLDWEIQDAGTDVAADLGLSPGARVFHMVRVRTADGLPMCIEDVWLPAATLPEDFHVEGGSSLYEQLGLVGSGPAVADQSIRATSLDERQAKLLQVPAHSPALVVSRVASTETGQRIERAQSVYRADRYVFTVSIRRQPGK